MTEQQRLAELEREIAGCHEHGAREFEHMADSLERDAAHRIGHDAELARLAAQRVRLAARRYREAHRCQVS